MSVRDEWYLKVPVLRPRHLHRKQDCPVAEADAGWHDGKYVSGSEWDRYSSGVCTKCGCRGSAAMFDTRTVPCPKMNRVADDLKQTGPQNFTDKAAARLLF